MRLLYLYIYRYSVIIEQYPRYFLLSCYKIVTGRKGEREIKRDREQERVRERVRRESKRERDSERERER
jgi:hypothetical protein